jgi:hypothetical protein
LNLPTTVQLKIEIWLKKYWEAFFGNYKNEELVEELDSEGILIATLLAQHLDAKVWYYSDAKQKNLSI